MISSETRDFFRWKPAAWLRVTGADAFTFLQGQFTNDLRRLAAAEATVYGLWLNHKGRVLADSFVLKGRADEFWVGSYFSPVATVRARLEAYVVADDVTIEDQTDAWSGVTIFGFPPIEWPAEIAGVALTFPGRRGTDAGRECVYPQSRDEQVVAALSRHAEISADAMEYRRIVGRIPAVPRDVGPGELPNEAALERDAISSDKGCYLGQEVMARLKTMGQVRRRLLRVRGGGDAPAAPAALFQGARQVGELRSVASGENGYVGLALLTLLHLDPSAGLSLAAGAAPALALDDTP